MITVPRKITNRFGSHKPRIKKGDSIRSDSIRFQFEDSILTFSRIPYLHSLSGIEPGESGIYNIFLIRGKPKKIATDFKFGRGHFLGFQDFPKKYPEP
jgi:hypothetical protein